MTDRITISLPDELSEEMHARFAYGDNRSEWIAEAIRMRLDGEEGDSEISASEETEPTGDVVAAFRDQLGDGPPKTQHGREACVSVFEILLEQGPMSTSEVQEAVFDRHSEHHDSPRSLWQSISRYLEDMDGIEKVGYGTWGADPSAVSPP